MQRVNLRMQSSFQVVLTNEKSQAAEMTLRPGKVEGGPDNRHQGSDQWLFVVSGTGAATVNGHSYPLRKGTLMLIERGDTHAIACTGRSPLRTLSFYVPPAYDSEGEELPAGRPA